MQRFSTTGLFLVCAVLAGGLMFTSLLNYQAASRASKDVLYSRAAELATSFISTARLTNVENDRRKSTQLAQEMISQHVSIAVVNPQGHVFAMAGADALSQDTPRKTGIDKEQALPMSLEVLRDLRLKGQTVRFIERGKNKVLEYWRPMNIIGPHRRWRRLVRDWLDQQHSFKGTDNPSHEPQADRPPADKRNAPSRDDLRYRPLWRDSQKPPRDADAPWRAMRKGQPFPGPRPNVAANVRILRVTVSFEAAEALIGPAKSTLFLSIVASPLLLLLGIVMFRAARRAQRAEEELRRKHALSVLGEMAAVLAHEIRTPLGSIKGNAQLIAESLATDDRLHSIVSEAQRLERLVNGLLNFARPREPVRALVDPDELIRRAAEIVTPKAVEAEIPLITEPAEAGVCLFADGDQILQVLVNLLDNAVEAYRSAKSNNRTVVIRAKRSLNQVSFSVLDNGPGINAAESELIFRPFFTTKEQGTGLGLSIARQIVMQNGGTLSLSTRKEGGTLARLEFPLKGGRS